MFRAITDESRRLMTGEPYEDRDRAYPPMYTGPTWTTRSLHE